MIGWSIAISQQTPEEWRAPDTAQNSIILASWKATFGGMAWIEKMSREGKISPLKGFPNIHLAFAEDILLFIEKNSPLHDDLLKIENSITPTGRIWDIVIYQKNIAACPASTILTICVSDMDY